MTKSPSRMCSSIIESPPIEVGIVESIDPHGPFGAKEAGETTLAAFIPALTNAVADAIASGLEMSLEERRERWTAMMETVRNNTFQSWGKSFLKVLKKAPYE